MAATLVMMVPVDDLLHFSNASFAAVSHRSNYHAASQG